MPWHENPWLEKGPRWKMPWHPCRYPTGHLPLQLLFYDLHLMSRPPILLTLVGGCWVLYWGVSAMQRQLRRSWMNKLMAGCTAKKVWWLNNITLSSECVMERHSQCNGLVDRAWVYLAHLMRWWVMGPVVKRLWGGGGNFNCYSPFFAQAWLRARSSSPQSR